MNHNLSDIVNLMKRGGYFETIMSSGAELDRVKQYLLAMDGENVLNAPDPLQHPAYPLFPGLNSKPFHDVSEFEGACLLQENFQTIKKEAQALYETDFLKYFPRGKHSADSKQAVSSSWAINFLYYMGVNLDRSEQCPKTVNIISQLPDVCLDYPWGDALFSLQAAKSHLQAHCSIDALRVRCHLGVTIPDDCGIRVGNERKQWEEGRCLVFEDSFEHEVWNHSDAGRIVLIVDFWHPDLTTIERQALTAGFRKSEIRALFYGDRINNTDASAELLDSFTDLFVQQDSDPLIQQFWS